jgi:hypothetical protein
VSAAAAQVVLAAEAVNDVAQRVALEKVARTCPGRGAHDLCHDGSDLPAAVVGGVILPGGDELTGQQSSDSRLHIRIGGKKLSSAVGS